MKKVFSFDAETNGLWGQAFAIGARVYDAASGEVLAEFVGRSPIEGDVDGFVQDKVLPQMSDVSESHADYNTLLADFAKFYLANKQDADVIVHMGVPVESKLLIDMHARGLIGDWDGPYPLNDVAGFLAQAGEDPTSVDVYVRKHGLELSADFAGGSHNPLYDSEACARVYMHLQGRACDRHPLLSKEIDYLDLSVRATNALKAANVWTVGDLRKFTEAQLLNLPNMGPKPLGVIKEALASIGVHLETSD